MRKILFLFGLFQVLSSCSGDDEIRNNPYLPDLNFSVRFDLSLPEYNQLNFPGNHFTTYNYGVNGIVIFNLNNDQYMAFELTDPNHVPQDCSVLTVKGTEATCSCNDGNKYTIVTGQQIAGEGKYQLKPYRIIRRGDILEVSN